MTLEDRFWSKVGPPDSSGCRPWLAYRDKNDYGIFMLGRARPAQGVAWRLTYHGPIHPLASDFMHFCDRPWCVEPSHTYPNTPRKNVEDMAAKGRQARGGRLPQTKLTEDDVREIRRRLALGERHGVIAARHGVSRSRVSEISRRGVALGWIVAGGHTESKDRFDVYCEQKGGLAGYEAWSICTIKDNRNGHDLYLVRTPNGVGLVVQ